ncbi:MAG: TetR/AcrR family transcriptional regulator [Actinobacteria bacterium]|nr:TetR/AcrR family transcriptional regulator [Actinomycetota bacterium]
MPEPQSGPKPAVGQPAPTAPAEPKLRADARRNREKVLRAARDAFAQSGYDVPLDEIAARAGVGAGTVYRHFPSKEALFEAVITARVTDLVADAEARAASAEPGPAFFGFLERIATEATDKRDLPDAIAIPGALSDAVRSALDRLLTGAQAAGAVRPGISAPDLIILFKGMFATLHQAAPDPATPLDPALRDRLFAIIADGLRPPR